MNMTSHSADRPCFTNFALQEYALGRLSSEVREEVETHVEECPHCAACAVLIEKETGLLSSALRSGAEERPGQPLEREMLAMYLDDSLDQETREKCEKLLAYSPQTLAALLSIRRELIGVLNAAVCAGEIPAQPEGKILRMSKRQILPKTISDLSRSESEAGEGSLS